MKRLLALALLIAPAFGAPPTFYRDVLPILQNHCQNCHREGQIGPMPFDTYRETRPWAQAVRDAVLLRKMPPWFADPAYGRFANDPSLSQADVDTIASWSAAAAPEGDPADAPPTRRWTSSWKIGTPDRVISMPKPFQVPAKGTVEYQYVILPSGFDRDCWVQKVEVRPSQPSVVHHAVVYIREPGSDWLKDRPKGVVFDLPSSDGNKPNPLSATTSDILHVYTPGNDFDEWPSGMAKRIKAGSDIVIQFHYTPNGHAAADQTSVGIIYANEPPSKVVLTLQLGNDRFVIPPGDPNYRVSVSGTMPNEALLLSLFAHMHLRGKAFEYSLVGDGGRVETLLKIPRYDFHWQLNYKLAEPRALRAGARLRCDAYFDNSANNPRNPDPSAEVRYGEQSWNEMMIGFFDVAVDAHFDKNSFFASRAK